jgi:hypothetical protein
VTCRTAVPLISEYALEDVTEAEVQENMDQVKEVWKEVISEEAS